MFKKKDTTSESGNKQAENGDSLEKTCDITALKEKEELLRKYEEEMKELKVGYAWWPVARDLLY